MESSHKNVHERPFRSGEFRDIWRNYKRTQFPHLLPIGVKFGVMTLQVILSSMSDFRGNRIWEIHTSLTRVNIITSAHAS
jgi:hypothetical protein